MIKHSLLQCKSTPFALRNGCFYKSIKNFLNNKINFIKNSSLVTSGLNFLKDNTLECDELYFKLITRVYFHIKKFVLNPNRVFGSI